MTLTGNNLVIVIIIIKKNIIAITRRRRDNHALSQHQYQGILRPTYKTMHVLLLREIWNKIKRTAAGPDHMLQKCREDHRHKFSP
jgi:hypothetical protein